MESKSDAFMYWYVRVKRNTPNNTTSYRDYGIPYEWMKNLEDFIQNFYNSFFFSKIFQMLPDWFPFYDMDTTLVLHLGCFEQEYQDSYWFQDSAPTTANENIPTVLQRALNRKINSCKTVK